MSAKDLSTLTSFYNTITHVSLNLIRYQFDDIDIGINNALAIMGIYAKVERSYVFDVDCENSCWNNTYEWCAEGIEPQINNLQNVPMDVIPTWYDRLNDNDFIYISDVSALENDQERELLESQDIKSLIVFPMFHNNELLGFIGFDAVHEHRTWGEEHQTLIRLACNFIASTLSNRKYREELLLKNTELKNALNNVKMLQGLLPICSNCKKIKDENGKWQDVAEYVHNHSEAEFSHGICPDCGKKLYPGMDDIFNE